MTKLKKYIFIS